MKVIKEARLEDEYFFNGCFWLISDSFKDIFRNNFTIIGDRYLVDINGNEIKETSKSSKVHKNVWKEKYINEYKVPFNYYPRGRLNIYNGTVYININSKINLPQVINKIIKFYELSKFPQDKIEVFDVDSIQDRNHYDFSLK